MSILEADLVFVNQIDALELVSSLPDNSIDMALIDPPYGVIRQKWDKKQDFELLFEQLRRITRPDGAIVVFTMQPFTTEVIQAWPSGFRYQWIWLKNKATNPLNAKNRPMRKHEEITVFSQRGAANIKDKMRYFPQGLERINKVIGKNKTQSNWELRGHLRDKDEIVQEFTGYPTSVLEFASENGLHPTQKPVPLLEYLIKTYTLPGEMVLDCFAGSGSTGVAALNTGRKSILGELDEGYVEGIKKRLMTVGCKTFDVIADTDDLTDIINTPNNGVVKQSLLL